VASGIVARLDRPSGNVTGFASFEASLAGKWLELLSEIAPGLKRAAIMFNAEPLPRIGLYALIRDGGPVAQGCANHCARS
jgi:putative ABC transport system substrate-binding protein